MDILSDQGLHHLALIQQFWDKSIITDKVSDKMTYPNSADPDQIAPEGAVWSGSTLFAFL